MYNDLHVYSQTEYIVVMPKEGSTGTVNFMTSGAGFFVIGRDHTSHTVKCNIYKLKIFSTA